MPLNWADLGPGYTSNAPLSPIHLVGCGPKTICVAASASDGGVYGTASTTASSFTPGPNLTFSAIAADSTRAYVALTDGTSAWFATFRSDAGLTMPLSVGSTVKVSTATVFPSLAGPQVAFAGTNSSESTAWLVLDLDGGIQGGSNTTAPSTPSFRAFPSPTGDGFLFGRHAISGSKGQLYHALISMAGTSSYLASAGNPAADNTRVLGAHAGAFVWLASESNFGLQLNLFSASTNAELNRVAVSNAGRLIGLIVDGSTAYLIGDASGTTSIGGTSFSSGQTFIVNYSRVASDGGTGITLLWARRLGGADKEITEVARVDSDAGTLMAVGGICKATSFECNAPGHGVVGFIPLP